MKRLITSLLTLVFMSIVTQAKTLIVYYSYTNNVHTIVTELTRQIEADILRIEPAVKGLNYAANNYAIGSEQISAIRKNPDLSSSYPAIDPVEINLADYDCIIIGAPLWWSNMAAPLQSFLFQHGGEMAGKRIGLIVSSSSSGISGVEGDAKRLIPKGEFYNSSLWVRSSQTSSCSNLIKQWLSDIDYNSSKSGIEDISVDNNVGSYTVYSVSGQLIGYNISSLQGIGSGIYIVNGKKKLVNN